jgi:hypothetical protein
MISGFGNFCDLSVRYEIELRLRVTTWNLYNRMTGRLDMRSDRDTVAREV